MEIDALNRMLEGIRENDDFRRRERSLYVPGIYQNQGGMGNVSNFGDSGGFNFLGGGFGGFIPNIANIVAQQQGPVLGPDDFGSYVIPDSDPTYSSGFDYARSIAGGIPMEQVIAPGVSYSPEQPMGYTQEQLTTPVGTTPVETPTYQEPDDPSFLGTGIGGVNIPVDRKQIPFRNIFGGTKDIRDVPPVDGLQNLGRMFGINREMQDIRDMIDRENLEDMLREQDLQELPPITPPFEQPMFPPFIEPNLQITNLPMTPDVNIPPIMELPQRRGVDRPNINRFSIEQLPMGLFA